MTRLSQPDVQESLLNHQTNVLAQISLSLVVDDLHVHIGLLLCVMVKFDVDVHSNALTNVHNQVN